MKQPFDQISLHHPCRCYTCQLHLDEQSRSFLTSSTDLNRAMDSTFICITGLRSCHVMQVTFPFCLCKLYPGISCFTSSFLSSHRFLSLGLMCGTSLSHMPEFSFPWVPQIMPLINLMYANQVDEGHTLASTIQVLAK